MSIRNAAKAILFHEGKILLNACRTRDGVPYYGLPGGGQNPYETMEEAIVRECLEETGYTAVPRRFVAVYEEIQMDERFRQQHPDYAHKILHIFLCGLADAPQLAPTEQDEGQLGSVWVDAAELPNLRLLPECVAQHMDALLHGDAPLYLGSHFIGEA